MTVRLGIPPEKAWQFFVSDWPAEVLDSDPPRRAAGEGWEVQFEPVVDGGTRIVFDGSVTLAAQLEVLAERAAKA